jgi:hypothetical protein
MFEGDRLAAAVGAATEPKDAQQQQQQLTDGDIELQDQRNVLDLRGQVAV